MRDYAEFYRRLLRDLSGYRSLSDGSRHLSPGYPARDIAADLLAGSIYKKLAPAGQSEKAILAGIEKFRNLNATLSFSPPPSGESESMSCLLDYFRGNLASLLDYRIDGPNCDLDWFRDHISVGPGASRGADATHFYTKLWESHHSYTDPYVLALFRAATSGSETWTQALKHWAKRFQPRLVEGNTLFTVPKNEEISRVCCTEPLINMMGQKAVGDFIESRLADWGIRLDRQPDLNRLLVKRGSETGAYGSIDLSSASDSIAWTLCQWAVPSHVLKWLRIFRSQTTRLPDGQVEVLSMVSTMGNGFTFPLETAIFASAVKAVYQLKGITPRLGDARTQNAAVFGDDIVVRKDCYDATIALLQRLGFSVNVTKSFNDGTFRESCGYDYYDGVNVRPVFVESLETPQDVYSAFNRLSRWSAENRIPLVHSLLYLRGLASFNVIPFGESDDSGFKVPYKVFRSKPPLKPRGPWPPVPEDGTGFLSYRAWTPRSTGMPIPGNQEHAKALGYKGFNPWGWELSFLGGYAQTDDRTFETLRSWHDLTNRLPGSDVSDDVPPWRATINRRPFQGEVLPRRFRTKSIPYWDWFGPTDEGRFSRSSFERWETLVAAVTT